MVGKIFITRSGYDPQLGKHVKDPYLGPNPTLGACRPDVRKQLTQGDHIFVISGKVPVAPQYVMGGFEIAAKIDPLTAYQQFPEQRLHRLPDGQLAGNIVINANGKQHKLDSTPVEVVGGGGTKLDENQSLELRAWLASLQGTNN